MAVPGSDAFPHWYPTLSLGLEIKKLPPAEGWEWLFMRVECMVVKGSRMDVGVIICDEDGDVVAISRQVAIIVGSERNVGKKAPAGKL